jgi:pyrroline-5-carboxylate reductase
MQVNHSVLVVGCGNMGAALADWQPDLVILALKPQVLGDALPELVGRCAGALVVSIAAGTSLARLRQLLGGQRRLVRAMPNLAAGVAAAHRRARELAAD